MDRIPPMKSGSLGFYNDPKPNRIETALQSILIVFFQNTCKNINEFCEHINLYFIPPHIIRLFLRFECITFIERNNVNEEIEEMIDYLSNGDFQDEEEESLYEIHDEIEHNPNYNCSCEKCNLLRTVDEYWDTFTPMDSLIISLKRNIDTLTDEDLLEIFS